MNTNGSHAAFPTTEQANESGLTKREYFAAMAMQGILSNPHGGDDRDGDLIARSAVAMADRLIEALNKETTR